MWLVRLLEVMNVTPVRRDLLSFRALIEKPAHGRVFTYAGGSHREEVISLTLDPDAKLDRINGSRLTDHRSQVLKLFCCFELKLSRVAALTQLFRL